MSDTKNGSITVLPTALPALPFRGPGREHGTVLAVGASRAWPGLLTTEPSSQGSRALANLRVPGEPALDVLTGELQVGVGLSATLQTFRVGDTLRNGPVPPGTS